MPMEVVAREARPEGVSQKQSLLIAWVDPLNEDRSGRGEVDPFKSKARWKVSIQCCG